MFGECRRRYYWNYYGYWNGWSPDAADAARLAYRLKKMQSLPMWLGDLVHRMIERILGDLRNRELNTLERYQKQARDLMNREWKQSLEKKWRWKPKYNLNLFEHYYGVDLSAEERLAAREKVFACLANFMRSDLFFELDALKPTAWKSVEKLDQFVVGEQPVFVKIDCAVAGEDGLAIYDWKTGKESADVVTQLGCYALYAYQVWRVPVERQRLVSFYLASDKLTEHRPTAEELIETKEFALQSMSEMIAASDSSADENKASVDNFPMTERRGVCRNCFFRESCFGTREWPVEGEAGG